jgi:RNA polymerase sigma factor (sigma-70 family)
MEWVLDYYEKEDLYNEYYAILLTVIDKYQKRIRRKSTRLPRHVFASYYASFEIAKWLQKLKKRNDPLLNSDRLIRDIKAEQIQNEAINTWFIFSEELPSFLTQFEKKIIYLYYLEDKTLNEIADRLFVSVRKIKYSLSEIRDKIFS